MRGMLLAMVLIGGCAESTSNIPTPEDTDRAEQAVLHFYGLGATPALRVPFAPTVAWSLPGEKLSADWKTNVVTASPAVPISNTDLAAALWLWKLETEAQSLNIPDDPTQPERAAEANDLLRGLGL